MGAVQRLATVVIVGLVALSTILLLYLADENNRIRAKEEAHREAAIERAITNYIDLCLSCHGPAGEGYLAPGEMGTGRIGAPLGGNTYATALNQEGIASDGSPYPGGVNRRAEELRKVIDEGRPAAGMPAWGAAYDGPLNDEQINELVTMIQHVDWNRVYNQAVTKYGGYPTPAPEDPRRRPTPAAAEPPTTPAAPAEGAVVTVESHDIYFEPTEVTIPANTPVKVILPNLGAAPHNFAIDALGISVDLMPGETKEIEINAPPGEYEFYCNVPGHREAGMVGKLIVSETATLPAEPTTAETPPADEAAPPAAGPVTVESRDIYFEPREITIPANTPVKVILPNLGAAPHDFTIDALDIHVTQMPGETKEIEITAPPGEYEFYCSVPGHREAGMVGTLIVE